MKKGFSLHRVMTAALLIMTLLVSMGARALETVTYYDFGPDGSAMAATDQNGNLVWKENYRPYGDRVSKQDGGTNSLWFAGKSQDNDTGLSYFGARYYDPIVGRFMGIDPQGVMEDNLHSFNRYGYGNNNPYKYVDPDGRFPLLLIPIAYALGGAGLSGATNAAFQHFTTGNVQWGGVGGVADAAGDGVILGPLGMFAGARTAGGLEAEAAAAAGVARGSAGKSAAPEINWGQQAKHFPGHNNHTPERSTMTSDPTKLAKKAGAGQQVGTTPVGSPGSKERVDFGEKIGVYKDPSGNSSPTTKGIIHYGKDRIHIVPARP